MATAAIPAADRVVTSTDNQPPLTPFEAISVHIDTLLETAKGFLDGDPITTQAMADTVGKLLDEARQADKAAEAQRKIEAKPFDDGKAEVQARYKPLSERCFLVVSTAKKALAPFLQAEQARIDAEAAAARKVADELAEAAIFARQQIAETDLGALDKTEALLKEADKAGKLANRAERGKAMATGGARSVAMRSVWTPAITDRRAALTYYMQSQPEELESWLLEQARRDVAAGARAIPGFTISETKVAQ
jgi:hypothetical protein